jgi:hypothetical protein
MEFGDDPRLNRLLQEWQVPDAPDALEQRVMGTSMRANGVYRWHGSLLRSHVRVPLPVALALSVALIWLVFLVVLDRMPTAPPLDASYDLAGFQPVNSVNVRIERSGDATQ